LVRWAREAHAVLIAGVSALADDDLSRLTTKHWGGTGSTGEVIAVMIHHDVYHAGEINHLRAMRQADDAWFSRQLHRDS
jgi:uncharacterized damage-inducible protein DinB